MKMDDGRTAYFYKLQKILAGEIINPAGNYLDIGCGPGYVLSHVAPKVKQAYGVDLSSDVAEVAKSLLGSLAEIRKADAQALPFDDRSMDAVTCYSTLVIVPDAEKVLSEITRVLKPTGRAVIHFTGLLNPHPRYWCKWYLENEGIQTNNYTISSARDALNRHGLKVKEYHGIGISDGFKSLSGIFHKEWQPDMDYRLSNLPILKWFASHYFFVVHK